MRTLTILLAILSLTGCRRVCGSWAPFWAVADCVAVEPGFDTGFGPIFTDTSTDTGTPTDSGLPECELMLTITVDGSASASATATDSVTLTANLANVSGVDQSFTVFEPCPDDLVRFTGLADGYDYYGTCTAGVCEDTGDRVTYTVSAGATQTITAQIDLSGNTCNDPTEAGDYTLLGTLPLTADTQPRICTVGAQLTVE